MQLTMWRGNYECAPINLPDGFSVRSYTGEEDIPKWVEISKYGLQDAIKTTEDFNIHMLSHEGLYPQNIYFVDHKGESVATVTAVVYPEKKQGYVHMVAAVPEIRGLGIGNELVNIVLNVFREYNLESAVLNTDDFRVPAIKSYIRAGFLPVLNGEDMESRWSRVLKECNIVSVNAVDENGNFIKRLFCER